MNLLELIIPSISAIIIISVCGLMVGAFVVSKYKKTNDMLSSIYGTENDLKKRIEQYVAKVARDELSALINDYKIVLEDNSRDLAQSLKNVAEGQITTLSGFIKEQEALIAKQSEFVVGEIINKAQADIEEYKKLQFDAVDLQVGEVVERLSREVLGKAISREEHEALIWDALEEAKKQGIFKTGVITNTQVSRESFKDKQSPSANKASGVGV